ncbi:TVP38/TMEM64 family protein [Ideonella paludis]|uniref:TVP38/TMEM64 family protein n=1 Tax=Ideonella paludis TaxID=1233411 RepID=UPI0036253A55
MKSNSKWWALLGLVVAVGAFHALGGSQFLSLAAIKDSQAALQSATAAQPLLAAAVYFVVYVVATALSLPGATVITLVGGALFGLGWGLLIVSFASSIGATLAFLASRWLLRDTVQARFGDKLAALNEGVQKDGAFYLFGLRLVPLFPFFMINLAMGLTPIRPWTFYWVSQVGMLAGTAVYVNAGTQLAQIDSLSGLASPSLIAAFALLGVFPLLARKLMEALQARKVYHGFTKPKAFDRNLVVIGGGAAGLVTSYIAAAVKAKVTLVEKHKLGGDCLNTGCVPSKALIRSAKFVAQVKKSADWGLRGQKPSSTLPRSWAACTA